MELNLIELHSISMLYVGVYNAKPQLISSVNRRNVWISHHRGESINMLNSDVKIIKVRGTHLENDTALQSVFSISM